VSAKIRAVGQQFDQLISINLSSFLNIFNFINDLQLHERILNFETISSVEPAGRVIVYRYRRGRKKIFNCSGNFPNPPKQGDSMRINLSLCSVSIFNQISKFEDSRTFFNTQNKLRSFSINFIVFMVFSYFSYHIS